MANKNKKHQKKLNGKGKRIGFPGLPNINLSLPEEAKKWIFGIVIFIPAIIITLSFFNLAGVAGRMTMVGLIFLIGKAVFIIPLILVLGGIVFL